MWLQRVLGSFLVAAFAQAVSAQANPEIVMCPGADLEFLDSIAPVAIALDDATSDGEIARLAYNCHWVTGSTVGLASDLVLESAPEGQASGDSSKTDPPPIKASQGFFSRWELGRFMTERRSKVWVRSVPVGAEIYFLNQRFGVTDGQFAVRQDIIDSLRVAKEGYQDCVMRGGAQVSTTGDKTVVQCDLVLSE